MGKKRENWKKKLSEFLLILAAVIGVFAIVAMGQIEYLKAIKLVFVSITVGTIASFIPRQ